MQEHLPSLIPSSKWHLFFIMQVLQQCLVSYCLQSFQQGQGLHDITAGVEQQALHILQKLQLERLLESEQFKQRCAQHYCMSAA